MLDGDFPQVEMICTDCDHSFEVPIDCVGLMGDVFCGGCGKEGTIKVKE